MVIFCSVLFIWLGDQREAIDSYTSHSSPFFSDSANFKISSPLKGLLNFSTVDNLGQISLCCGAVLCPGG